MTVFVIAMESEAAPVLANMENVEEREVFGKKLYTGTLAKKSTAVFVCGVGKCNAAAGAQYCIDCLKADKIINVGVAGGLNSSTAVGEIYEISSAVQYDFDLVAINGTPMGTLNEFNEPCLPLSTVNLFPSRRLGTGDRFNDDEKDFLLLTKDLKADVRDMEGGAIAQICIHAGVPFYSFKAISDLAGAGSTPDQFAQNLKTCAHNLGQNIIKIFEAVNG